MTTIIPNGRLIVVNYPAGAAGKMVQNCLGLSYDCILKRHDWAEWQLNNLQPTADFYQQKLEWVLSTVPDTIDPSWLDHELGEEQLFGFNWTGFKDKKRCPKLIYQLAERGLWVTVTTHNYVGAEYYDSYWPTRRDVCLLPSEQFARRFLPLKNPDIVYDEAWTTDGRTPKEVSIEIDIDNSIWSWHCFSQEICRLYQYLGFRDWPVEHIRQYYEKYIALHR